MIFVLEANSGQGEGGKTVRRGTAADLIGLAGRVVDGRSTVTVRKTEGHTSALVGL